MDNLELLVSLPPSVSFTFFSFLFFKVVNCSDLYYPKTFSLLYVFTFSMRIYFRIVSCITVCILVMFVLLCCPPPLCNTSQEALKGTINVTMMTMKIVGEVKDGRNTSFAQCKANVFNVQRQSPKSKSLGPKCDAGSRT